MTIVAVADMYGIGGRRAELLELLRGAERDASEAPGSVRYTVAAAIGDPDHYVIVGEWRNLGALEAHYASPAFTEFQRALHGLLARPSQLTVHTVSGSTSPQPSGLPDPRDVD